MRRPTAGLWLANLRVCGTRIRAGGIHRMAGVERCDNARIVSLNEPNLLRASTFRVRASWYRRRRRQEGCCQHSYKYPPHEHLLDRTMFGWSMSVQVADLGL